MEFFRKVFSLTFLIASSLLLIYTIYRSEIYWGGKIRDYFSVYYVISLLSVALSIFTLILGKKINEYITIIIISFVFSVYLFEFILTDYSVSQSIKEQLFKEQLYEKKTGKKWDHRRKIKVYKDLKKVSNEVTIRVAPNTFLNKDYPIFPLSSVSNSKTVHCNENGYYSSYQSDRYGFNNPDEEWDQTEIEYLLVGDSFLHGACVNRPDDISSVLRRLSNKSVLNLGYEDNGPLLQYATLREYLNSKVKNVVWIYYEGNDIVDLEREHNNPILNNYLVDLNFTQNLKLRQNEIDKIISDVIKKYEKKYTNEKKIDTIAKKTQFNQGVIRLIKISTLRSLLHKKIKSSKHKPEFKKILKLAKDITNKNNSKFYFVYLPSYNRYKSKYIKADYDYVKNTVNELNIPFIDINKEVFMKENNPLKLFPFRLFGHYNVEGYEKTANAIYNFFKD